MPTIAYFSNLSPQKVDTAVGWQLSFAKKYEESGCDYIWVVFSSSFDNTFKALKKEGLHVEIIPTKFTRGFRLVIFLLRFIIAKKVTILHMHFIKQWNAILLIILSKIFLQNTLFIYHKRSPGKLIANKFNIKKYVNPLSLLSVFVDKIVCNSDAIVENCIERGVRKKKAVRIYNGINIDRFKDLKDTGRIRKEFNIPQHYKIIAVIKDARPEVRLGDLLHSIPKVLSLFPDIMFLIVGGGVKTDRLRALVKRLRIDDNVIFAGIRNDIPEIISGSYFTVDPSPVEAFGNVIVESMAGRKPVIAVNAWGPKEIIVHGETGLLVEPDAPTDFAPAIIELLSYPSRIREMGNKSLERAQKYFSAEDMINNTVALTMEYLS